MGRAARTLAGGSTPAARSRRPRRKGLWLSPTSQRGRWHAIQSGKVFFRSGGRLVAHIAVSATQEPHRAFAADARAEIIGAGRARLEAVAHLRPGP